MLNTLRRHGSHPLIEPYVAAALRARAVKPSWRFFAGESLRRGSGTYAVRRTSASVYLEHGTTDAATFDQAFLHNAYEPTSEARQRLQKIGRPLRALDLGANVGMWSTWLLTQWPDAEITAIEPLPRNVALLRRNLQLADENGHCHVLEAAAGTTDGTVTFGGGDFTNGRILTGGDGVAVRMIDTFDLMNGVDLLKLDIEGGEWPIITDSRFATITAPVVMLEVHPMSCPSKDPLSYAGEILEAANYRTAVQREPELPGTGTIWAVRP